MHICCNKCTSPVGGTLWFVVIVFFFISRIHTRTCFQFLNTDWIARPRLDCRHSTRLSVSEIFYFVLRDQFLIKIRYNSHRSTSPMPTTICFRATRVSSDYERQFVFYRVNNTVIRTLCYHWSLVLISDELMLHHPSTFSNSIEETDLV